MTRRFRPTAAYVDESIRGRRYLLGCVLVDPHDVTALRRSLRDLVLTGSRLHFHQESAHRKRELFAVMATWPINAFVVCFERSHGVTEFASRDKGLRLIVERLQRDNVGQLVIESRQDDTDDERTINRARFVVPPLVFERRLGVEDPLLWLADGLTWAVGAGEPWRSMIGPVLSEVVDLP